VDSLKLTVAEVGLKRVYIEVLPDDELYVVCECRRRKITKPIRYALSDLLSRLHYMRPRIKLVIGSRIMVSKVGKQSRRSKYMDMAITYLGRLRGDFGRILIIIDANAIYIGKILREAKRMGSLRGVDLLIISDPRPDSDIAGMSINMLKRYRRVVLITHDKWFAQLRGVDVVLLENKGLNSMVMDELMGKLEPALQGISWERGQ